MDTPDLVGFNTDGSGQHRVMDIAPSSDLAERTTRLGWLAKGIVFATIGVLGIEIARRGTGGDDADQTGALAALADVPAGRALVFIVAAGLVLFAVWNFWAAAVDDSESPLDVAKRVGTFGLGCSYGLLGMTGFQIALDRSSSSSDGGATSPETVARFLLDIPAGRAVLIGVGLGTCAVGVYHLWKGLSLEFLGDIDTDDLSPATRHTACGPRRVRLRRSRHHARHRRVPPRVVSPKLRPGRSGRARRIASYARVGTLRALAAGLASVGLIAAGVYDAITFRRQRID